MAVKEDPQIVPDNFVDLTTHRAQMFSELGFGHDDAFTLANTRKSDGFYLYWGEVAKALSAGATHEMIIDWYTYPVVINV